VCIATLVAGGYYAVCSFKEYVEDVVE